MIENLYEEVAQAGSLTKALDLEFEKIQSLLRCSVDDELSRFPFTYARIENKNRFSQIYLAADKKLYLPDFWRNGVCLAHGETDNMAQLAEILNCWLCSDINTRALQEKFQCVVATEKATAFDENREVEYTWNVLLHDNSRADIRSFVELAIEDKILSTLFPFTSLTTLCFSRCTGYPYTYDTPIVIPISTDIYEVRLSNNYLVGTGSAMAALHMVKQHLSPDLKPAMSGTAKDVEKYI